MSIVVQKFGGTSVATPELRQLVVNRVEEALQKGCRPVVVVSAMGRDGDPYATDTLKSMLEDLYREIPLRELDMVMHCGEIISAAVLTATLYKNGLKARTFTGSQAGLVTDGNYSGAQVIDCRTGKLESALEEEEIAVVAGFQGATTDNEINTLGRGGSDTTAVILGAALGAEQVEIYTDVDGIATADPRILEEARVIEKVTYSEVCQMAYEGARVIHPFAVEVAMKNRQPVVVKNLHHQVGGTVITSEGDVEKKDYRVHPERAVTGIAHTTGLVQFQVELDDPDSQLELEMFQRIADAGVNIDLISVFPTLKFFTVEEDMQEKTGEVLQQMGINFRLEKECAKVSVIGVGMRNLPGVMARVVKALKQQEIEILQTADSNITISLLIPQKDLSMAVRTLHEHFGLGEAGETVALRERAMEKEK